eukprot:SAG22_NODE_164_length_16817_cov_61.573573_14_plen_127_part_00
MVRVPHSPAHASPTRLSSLAADRQSAPFCLPGLYNDTPIGAVAARIEEDPDTKLKSRLYIMTLGVLEPYRNLSVGHQLLEYIVNISESEKEFKDLKTVRPETKRLPPVCGCMRIGVCAGLGWAELS